MLFIVPQGTAVVIRFSPRLGAVVRMGGADNASTSRSRRGYGRVLGAVLDTRRYLSSRGKAPSEA